MIETSARLLRLLSLLQSRPEWSGPDLAERLGVSTRTVRRDVDKLRGLDYPVEVDLGPTGGYRLGAGGALPPLLLDDDEAVAVALTLQTAASGGIGVTGLGETALAALIKLERILPERLRRRVAAVPVSTVLPTRAGPAVDPGDLVAVGAACRDHRVLELDYTPRDGVAGRRRVEPHHLVSWGRRWYLVAWDLGRDDWRTLRLDRCAPRVGPDGLPTGPRFTPRPLPGGDDPARFVSERVADLRGFRATAVVAAPPDVVRARMWATPRHVEDLGDDGCRVHLATDDLASAVLLFTEIDLEFTVEAPPELAEAVRARGERCLRAVAATPAS